MKNTNFMAMCAVAYILVLLLFIRKARDIFANRAKYNEIPGWSKYRYSFWYEPMSDYHQKIFSKNYFAPIITTIPMMGAMIALYYYGSEFLQKVLFVPQDATMLHSQDLLWGVLAAIFYSIILSIWICINSSAPILIASSRFAFSSKERSGDWRKLIISMMVASILLIPPMALGMDSYTYATKDKLVINPMLSIKEKDIFYSDIVRAETSFESSKDEWKYYLSYKITSKDGTQVDLFDFKNSEVLLIHRYLQENHIVLKKGSIGRETYDKMCTIYDSEKISIIALVFKILQ